jgi:hypothetical protein
MAGSLRKTNRAMAVSLASRERLVARGLVWGLVCRQGRLPWRFRGPPVVHSIDPEKYIRIDTNFIFNNNTTNI